MPRSIALVVLMVAVSMAPHLKADVVLFTDNHGTGLEVIPPYYIDLSGCMPLCQPGDTYPFTVVTNTIPATVYIGDPNGYVSDEITSMLRPPIACSGVPGPCGDFFTGADFVFSYGLDLRGSPFTCASVGGCDFTYNGAVQDVGVITWGPGLETPPIGYTTTLQFQHDAQSSTPEPSSPVLLMLGLLSVASMMYRRKQSATNE
jgi:hypothetical protein